MKIQFVSYTDAESLLEIMGTCEKDLEKSSTLYIVHSTAKNTNIVSEEVKTP